MSDLEKLLKSKPQKTGMSVIGAAPGASEAHKYIISAERVLQPVPTLSAVEPRKHYLSPANDPYEEPIPTPELPYYVQNAGKAKAELDKALACNPPESMKKDIGRRKVAIDFNVHYKMAQYYVELADHYSKSSSAPNPKAHECLMKAIGEYTNAQKLTFKTKQNEISADIRNVENKIREYNKAKVGLRRQAH